MVKALTPDYVLGCKRPLLSNTFYPSLVQPNVTFVPHGIREVREQSVVDATGEEHPVDTIIYGTGFHVTDLPIAKRVHGAGGRSLEEVWDGHPNAHFGTSINGFPNAFMLFGPNIGTASAFTMLEAQLTFLTGALRAAADAGLASFDVRPDAQARWNEEVQAHLDGTVWTAGGCTSYYLDGTGRNSAAWPWTMREMTKRLSRFPIEDYDLVPEVVEPAHQDEPAAAPA
jgi:cyclohexanone monooxygenase